MIASVPAEDLNHILAHTNDIWRELAGSRLFITGGTGFFGIWLLEAIAAANDAKKLGVSATVLSRNPASFLERMPHLALRGEFEWLTGHPASFEFPSQRHDYILHLATATSAHLGQTDPREMLATKFSSICHVLDYARHANIRRMLVTSSGAIYGPQPPDLSHIPETYQGAPDPLLPVSAYGQGKRLIEQVCAITPEVDIVIARCFSFIGPHLPLEARFAVGNFIRDALVRESIVIQGDGSAVRSYLHAADLTTWLLKLLINGRPRTAYNVGSDESTCMLDLAHRISSLAPHSIDITIQGKSTQPAEIPSNTYVPNIFRARSEVGLDVRLKLDAALTRTLRWAATQVDSMPA